MLHGQEKLARKVMFLVAVANFIGQLMSHVAAEKDKGFRPFRRRLRSQGASKVGSLLQQVHNLEIGAEQTASTLLESIKKCKYIKGMAVLLVRQCILHGLVTNRSLSSCGHLGPEQGLSQAYNDYGLGHKAPYADLGEFVLGIQRCAARQWKEFEGTSIHKECDHDVRATLLNESCLSDIDGDALGCEGRRLESYLMGMKWKFGEFKSAAVNAPGLFDCDWFNPDQRHRATGGAWTEEVAEVIREMNIPEGSTYVIPDASSDSGFSFV